MILKRNQNYRKIIAAQDGKKILELEVEFLYFELSKETSMRRTLTHLLYALATQQLIAATPNYPYPSRCNNCAPPPCSAYDFDLYHKDLEVWFASGEFLYWTVDEGALDYAQRMKQPAWSPTASYASGTVESASFDISPGFRVSAGYFNAPKYWLVEAEYTHLISTGKNRAEKPTAAAEFLTGTWPQITTNPLQHAHSKIFFDFNLFEVFIHRIFIPNPHLRLTAMGGFSAVWMHQDWKVQYFDGGGGDTTIRNQWRYIAGGLRTATFIDWYWGNHVYLTAGSSIALYMGSYKNQAKQTTTVQPVGSDASLPVRDSVFNDTRPSCALQFTLGPSFQKNFGCNRVELFVGYEINGWFNLQEIRRSTSGSPSEAKETWMSTSMLALQGLTTRFTVDF